MNKETLNYFLLVAITLAIAIVISMILRKILSVFITKYAKKMRTDPTNFSFIKNSVGFIIYTTAVIFIFLKIPYLKSIGTALFAGAGILTVVIGFASQKAFANIISGIFILIFKPFKISDIIEFKDGQKGTVEEITLRHTLIKDYENRRIIIPNSVISEETIINSNIQDEKIRKHIEISISYDSNIDKAMDILRDEAEKHPLLIDNRTQQDIENNEPCVIIRVIALSDYSVDLKAYVWTAGNDNAFILKCDLLKSVKERFDREGIEIPFPYRTIVYKKDLSDGQENS
ncbi:mechanosensitive ion channel family protein [Ancylomarina euxinus]|uniref:Mechanosensitive ion channel family protein n=1 Tax=Ancylomarina euxinus TaxID=2283627 RepID=A0A425Y8D6_9BACT|nr:mechanosensitive ion channel family protein [Ancylomarina euxinus]MCZ4693380.1 mechanosensitive ion channel family protein [Ancylomarina euxinus]MUP13608.1 mechanosensitive ion channel [Ancylomarina euxinus]RRG24746.1 mechanosensitive ion channel family protein [Ancylomarina euxinus]